MEGVLSLDLHHQESHTAIEFLLGGSPVVPDWSAKMLALFDGLKSSHKSSD